LATRCQFAYIYMTQLVRSNRKTTDDPIAIKANIAHSFITQRGFEMIKAMITCGEILCTKKYRLGHGRWLPWVKLNLDFHFKTANNYMRLYENRDEILLAEPGSLREALSIIADTDRITPGLLSGDEKILIRNIVSPIRVVKARLRKLPKDPMHYESVVRVMQMLTDALKDLMEEIS